MAKRTPQGKPTKHPGKTETFTNKLTPATKRKALQMAHDDGLSVADWVEDLVLAEHARRKGR